jgi:hypothetical protein
MLIELNPNVLLAQQLKRGDSPRVRVGDSGRGESCRRQGKAWLPG